MPRSRLLSSKGLGEKEAGEERGSQGGGADPMPIWGTLLGTVRRLGGEHRLEKKKGDVMRNAEGARKKQIARNR